MKGVSHLVEDRVPLDRVKAGVPGKFMDRITCKRDTRLSTDRSWGLNNLLQNPKQCNCIFNLSLYRLVAHTNSFNFVTIVETEA